VAYHGAVLAAVESATGWDARQAHLIVGTSAGSITASMLRAGVPPGDLAAISEGRPLSATGARLAQIGRPHRPRPRPAHLLGFRAVGDPVGVVQALARGRLPFVPALPAGGIPTTPISAGIDTLFAGRWPDQPLWICAVDIRTGERVVFGAPGAPAAPVGSAVAASAAIPSYFAPVSIDGRRYVDGGVRSLVNLDLVVGSGLDLVVVSSPLSHASPVPWPAASTPMRQLLRARLRLEVAAVRRAGVPVVVIEPGRRVSAAMGLNPMDARRRGSVSRATREAVGDWLARGVTGRRLADALRGVSSPPAPEPESGTAVG
jgi:NTE family protein